MKTKKERKEEKRQQKQEKARQEEEARRAVQLCVLCHIKVIFPPICCEIEDLDSVQTHLRHLKHRTEPPRT